MRAEHPDPEEGHISRSSPCKWRAPMPTPRLGPGTTQANKNLSQEKSVKARVHCFGMLGEPRRAHSIPASTWWPVLYVPREHPEPRTLFRNSTLGLRQLLGKASSEEAPKPEGLACASAWAEGSSSATSASSPLHCSPLFLAPAPLFVALAGLSDSPGAGTAAVWAARAALG